MPSCFGAMSGLHKLHIQRQLIFLVRSNLDVCLFFKPAALLMLDLGSVAYILRKVTMGVPENTSADAVFLLASAEI